MGGKGSQRGSAEESFWLPLYHGRPIVIDRKTGDRKTLFVPKPCLNITGAIQPGVVQRVLAADRVENGLAARLLLAMPTRVPKRWTENEISDRQTERLAALYDRLRALDGGEAQLDGAARDYYIDFFERNASELAGLSDGPAAAWSKLEEVPLRLGLIFHLCDYVTDPDTPVDVGLGTMKKAVQLTEWFKHEARRLYGRLILSKEDEADLRLVDWIADKKGGEVDVRDLQRGQRWIRNTAEAETVARRLVAKGLARWATGPGLNGQAVQRISVDL